jgi:glycosyltransferase involved in cell wall biosynthesis
LKILYISTVFPSPEESSTIYTDLAEELHKRGHELFVVVAEEKRKIKNTVLREERGFPVLRVRIGNLYDVGFVEKGITIMKLKTKLKKAMRKYLRDRKFDFILFESPPVTTAGVVKWAMKHFDCPSYLMLKDIFPQNGVDIGIIQKGGIIHRYFRWKEKKLYETATIIGCMSEANKRYILNKNPWINQEKVELFPNTKCIRYKGERSSDFAMRRKYGIPEDAVVAIYGGNMGKPQGLDFLMSILSKCKNRRDVFFLLVGRGTERDRLLEYISREKLDNVLMLEALPRDDYERLLAECDIGLIFLDRRFTIPNFPSRVLSYFEYRIPVLAATDIHTDFGEMIEKAGAGFWVPAGDENLFLNKLNKLVFDIDLRHQMGCSGRDYLEKYYTVEVSAKILEQRFQRRIKY